MDWYTAGTMLEKQRQQGVPVGQIAPIPFFENLFPAGLGQLFNSFFGLPDDNVCPGQAAWDPSWSNTQSFYAMNSRVGMPGNDPGTCFFSGNDWTDTEALVDQVLFFTPGLGPSATRFMQPQYGTLSTWGTLGNSNYHALAVSLRQRLNSLTVDFNYTYAHSLDDASGLQTEGGFGNNTGNGAFIVNPIRQRLNYASSDFDVRHSINADAIWQLPFGKGQAFMGHAGRVADAILGGWQLSGIFRWNTGLPTTAPFDDSRWATNWDFQSNVSPLAPLHSSPGLVSVNGTPTPKLFAGDINKLYQNFRNAYPGESGPRNYLRYPGYIDLDLGLAKTWKMPWNENHQLQLRWDAFNVTNTQRFGLVDSSRTGLGVGLDPGLTGLSAPDNWSNFIQIQGQPRVMQVGARYSF